MKSQSFVFFKPAHRSAIPILFLLLANLIAGLFTFQNYGLSWDEPLFYQYADAVPYAYSIPAHLSGEFNIEKAYGPSAEDHKFYGPAYLLLAKPAVDLLYRISSVPWADLWHLVNFLTFQVGVVLFYFLCLRWMSAWAAFGASLLFSTQPVLWGHAWINPKDVPFTVFFIAAVFFGFKMVDALTDLSPSSDAPTQSGSLVNERNWQVWRRIIQVITLVLLLLLSVSYIFSNPLQDLLRYLIQAAYQSPTDSFLGRIFAYLAVNAQTVAEEAYINKGLALFFRLRTALLVLGLVFLIPAIFLTFWNRFTLQMVNQLANILAPLPARPAWWWKRCFAAGVAWKILLAGILLGVLVSIRVIGPLAGLLVCLYFFSKHERRSLAGLVAYGGVALLALYFAWPYLWDAPLARFVEVLQHMSHNPKVLPVLFAGTVYPSDKLPMSYLPVMLGITLTWPVWPAFIAGVSVFVTKVKPRLVDWHSLLPVLLWFLLPFLYVLLLRPPMYDGYRHFLFLLPPVFILIGLLLQVLVERLQNRWGYAMVLTVLAVPGVIGLMQSHPYEYAYYNLLTGGLRGAFRQYETDFWLTCYKELMVQFDKQAVSGTTLFVHRQPSIARQYASPGINVERFDPDDDRTFPGSLLLLTTRANVDLSIHTEAPETMSVGRDGAIFCLVKKLP